MTFSPTKFCNALVIASAGRDILPHQIWRRPRRRFFRNVAIISGKFHELSSCHEHTLCHFLSLNQNCPVLFVWWRFFTRCCLWVPGLGACASPPLMRDNPLSCQNHCVLPCTANSITISVWGMYSMHSCPRSTTVFCGGLCGSSTFREARNIVDVVIS